MYISMKNEDVEMDTSVMKAFYQAFQTHSADAIGDNFDQFASKVRACLEKEPVAESDPERSPSSFLDVNDKCFFGQMGVALMSYCHQKKLFSQGYNVLHVLHNFSINYSLYTGEFGIQQRPLSTTEVSLTAADICLHLDTPAATSALEVLRGTNYALPAQDSGRALSQEEAGWRRRVIHTLCQSFIAENQLTFVDELLSDAGDVDVFGRNELKALYNELLVSAIDNRELDFAGEVLKSMDSKLISRDRETIRALVKGFGEAGRLTQAKQHFISGCLSGFYPISFKDDNPWTVVIGTSFSALESQFFLENHLLHLYLHIEELARKSGIGVLDETNYHPLRVVVESDEVTNSRSKYIKPDEIIRCVRDMLCTVLTDDFNPPLSCQPQSNDQVKAFTPIVVYLLHSHCVSPNSVLLLPVRLPYMLIAFTSYLRFNPPSDGLHRFHIDSILQAVRETACTHLGCPSLLCAFRPSNQMQPVHQCISCLVFFCLV